MFKERLALLVERPKQMALWVGVLGVAPFLFRWASFVLMMLMTLRRGAKESFGLVILLSGIALVELKIFAHVPPLAMGFAMVVPFFFWIVASVLRHTASWAKVFQLLTVFGLMAVFALYHWAPKVVLALHDQAMQSEGLARGVFASLASSSEAKQMPDVTSQFDVGLMVLVFSAVILITLMVARYLQAKLYNPGGFKRECYTWVLSQTNALILLLAFVFALTVHTSLALNMLPILMIGPACVGFSLLHWYTARFKYQSVILFVSYVLIVMTYLLVILALIGWLDSFFHFRKRMKEVNL